MHLYDTTIGIPLVGIFLNTFLYGFVTYQFVAYHRTKFDDPLPTRCMVLFLFILDTFHSVSVVWMVWNYTVTNYDDPIALTQFKGVEWPHAFTPFTTALTALVTQMYLGHRIWRLTWCKVLYGVVIVLAIPSFILGMACSVEAWSIKLLSELPRITSISIGWLSLQVAVDMFIATTLIIIFSRSRTGFRKTDTVLNRLIRGAIQTGLIPAIFAVGDLITFIVCPSFNLYVMFAIPIGRIYTNTLLDSLLVRESLRAEMSGTHDMDEINSITWAPAESPRAPSAQLANAQRGVRTTVQNRIAEAV